MLEAVRQCAARPHPRCRCTNCDLALAHGTGGSLARGTSPPPSSWKGSRGDGANRKTARSPHRRSTSKRKPSGRRAAQGKLLIKKCTACGEPHFYPRNICPFCFSDKTEWVEASGNATIYTYSVMRRAPGAVRDCLCDLGRADDHVQHRRLRPRRDQNCGQAVKSSSRPTTAVTRPDVRAGITFDCHCEAHSDEAISIQRDPLRSL